MIYKFYTSLTMKEYNRAKWWISSDYVQPIKIEAETIKEALKDFVDILADKYYITVSKSALKAKNKMFRDTASGETIQVGYILTGSTEFQNDKNYTWSRQYIDIWAEIKEERAIEF